MKQQKAFTLLELIFVIVILGIVSSIGSEIIAKVYGQYIVQRAQHRASLKTELAIQIALNRLQQHIPHTIYRIKNDNTNESMDTVQSGASEDYKGIQWVSADIDSFNYYDSGIKKTGWSGFCDVNASSASDISTPGSDIDSVATIVSNLGGNLANGVIYFPFGNDYNISGGSDENITLDSAIPGGGMIYEQYKLAWTSYALVVESETINGKTYKNLYLYYNFAPIPGSSLGNNKSLLLRNIREFKLSYVGETLRFKICKSENIGEGNITACKEKAVLR